MRFTDFPRPTPAELYEEAIRRYVEAVADRVHAVYHTGAIDRPGLSDVDLIVVPRHPRYDNYAYFSKSRLPRRFQVVFRHEPFVLPPDVCGIVRYTSHTGARLVHGADVLPPDRHRESLEDGWSMVVEDFCRYRAFIRSAEEEGQVPVCALLSKLLNIRIPINTLGRVRLLSALSNHLECESARRGEALCASWFEDPRPAEQKADDAWRLLRESLAYLTVELGELTGTTGEEEVYRFALAFLRGERLPAGVDPALVLARQQAIRAYLEKLCQFRIFYGSLVPNTLFTDEFDAYRLRYRPPRPVRAVVKLRYRLEGIRQTLRSGSEAPAV